MDHLNRDISIGEKYFPIFKIHDQEEADKYFELLVFNSLSLGVRLERAEELERTNICHILMAAHPRVEIVERIKRLFKIDPELWRKAMETFRTLYDDGQR